jgi:polyferredoxin
MTAKVRRVVQIFFLLFFLFLFLIARFPYRHQIEADLFLRFSPLIPLFDFIQNFRVSLLFWPALVILVATLFLGRFFCGWICPLGTGLDIASKIVKSPSNRVTKQWDKWRPIKFGVLVGSIVLAVFSINVWGYLDPLSIFNRGLTAIFYPLFTLGLDQLLLAAAGAPVIGPPATAVYDLYKTTLMPESQAVYQHVFWIALFVGGIFALEKLSRRFWCRNLCPAGAWLGFLAQFRMFERIVGEACPVCNKCTTECKMNAIPAGDVVHTSKVECIDCFNCGAVCPPKINAITYRWRWRPYHTEVDFSRRQFVHSSVGSVAALGLLNLPLIHRDSTMKSIRPPGALAEPEFQDRCIRCLECVRICDSNGGCLQPGQIENSLLELWLPIAVMREGYCEYNCNLCTQVCPTDAIIPLTLEQKQHTPIGLAYFDKNLCIPYAQSRDCLVCEEHCPTPDKAIKFELKEVILPGGQVKRVKFPYVIRELCIGCGICEEKCPLPGKAGVFVANENQTRFTPSGEPIVKPAMVDSPADPYGG